MPHLHQHSWDVTPAQAREIQETLRAHVIREDRFGAVNRVAGVDAGFEDGGTITRAAVVVLSFPELELVEQAVARRPTSFPYVPGLLSFREIPAVLEALAQLKTEPDLLLCDGQGIAHPRRCGFTSHIGLITGRPTIGVAKSLLIGTHGPVPEARGDWTPILHQDEIIGAALRTRIKVRPVYVSIGHKVSLNSAIAYVMRCTTRFRLPETTRKADRLASPRGHTGDAAPVCQP
ncbi:MAG: deoxyribonuclease V [Gammaproteobacteria bacterium]